MTFEEQIKRFREIGADTKNYDYMVMADLCEKLLAERDTLKAKLDKYEAVASGPNGHDESCGCAECNFG